jgi:hypothetical protein
VGLSRVRGVLRAVSAVSREGKVSVGKTWLVGYGLARKCCDVRVKVEGESGTFPRG